MRMLKLGTIDFDYRSRCAQYGFSGDFHSARLARACGTKEEEVAYRTTGSGQTDIVHIENVDDLLYSFALANHLLGQMIAQISCSVAPLGGV